MDVVNLCLSLSGAGSRVCAFWETEDEGTSSLTACHLHLCVTDGLLFQNADGAMQQSFWQKDQREGEREREREREREI